MEVQKTRRDSAQKAADTIHGFVEAATESPVQWLHADAVISLKVVEQQLNQMAAQSASAAPAGNERR